MRSTSFFRIWLFPLAIAATILFASETTASGAGRRTICPLCKRFSHRSSFRYYNTYRTLNYYYPKYIGGLHSSYFNSLGVPSGDVGLRGNGFYMTPW